MNVIGFYPNKKRSNPVLGSLFLFPCFAIGLSSCLKVDNSIKGSYGPSYSTPPEGAIVSLKTAPLTNQATSIFDVQCGEATHYLVSPSKPEENSSEWSVCNTGEKEVTLIEGTNTFPFWFKRGSYLVESAQTIEVLLDTAAPSPPSSILGGVSMGSLVRSPSIQYSSGTDAQSGVLKNQVRVLKVSDSAVIRDWTDHEPGEPILGLSLVALESYRVELRSVDMAGNLSSSVSSSDWIAGRAQGIHDVDFANGGVYSTSGNYVSNEAKKIIFAPNQKILVTGLIRDLGEWGDIFLHRLLPNGVPDSSFGTNGKIVIDLTPFDFGTGLFIDSMNRIILGGAYTTTENPFLYRFTNSGSIDSSFGTNGFVAKSVAGENFARAMTVDPSDGSYYIVGDDYGDSAYVTKFTVNGAVDNTFATSGYYLIGTHVYAYALDAEVDLNGKLVVVGRVKPGGSGDDWAAILWRFNSNGTLDTSFNSPSGYLLLDDQLSANVTESANGLLIDASNDYLIVGSATNALGNSDIMVWKVSSLSATLISSFGGFGSGYSLIKSIGANDADESGNKMKFDSSGRIVIAGSASNGTNLDMVIVRLSSNGVLDTSFGNSGALLVGDLFGYGGNDVANDLDIDASGSIAVCGRSDKASGDSNAVVIHIY